MLINALGNNMEIKHTANQLMFNICKMSFKWNEYIWTNNIEYMNIKRI